MLLVVLLSFRRPFGDPPAVGVCSSSDEKAAEAAAAAAALAALLPPFGNDGLWAAMLIAFVARGVTLGWRYPALEKAVG